MSVNPALPWTYDLDQASLIQENLSKCLSLVWGNRPVKTIAGIDVSYSGVTIHAAIAFFNYPQLTHLTTVTGVAPQGFPYVAGLLAFRVGPAILETWEKLKLSPDLILIHGHGIAHPRGLGLASHMGLWLDRPTIGVARTRLYGNHAEVGPLVGDWSEIRDERNPKHVIGAVLRTQSEVKPIYVSPGHLIDLPHSIEFVLTSCRKYRLPEPLREAHEVAARAQMQVIELNNRANHSGNHPALP